MWGEIKLKDKEFCTKSVLNFLKGNTELVKDYFDEVFEDDRLPNYSDMLRYVSGTTADDVNLASTMVVRSEVTEYLRNKYECYLKERGN